MSTPSQVSTTSVGQPPARERVVLACVCACTILVVGFVASINLAVPKLAASTLAPTASQLLWVVDSYVVLFACLVIPAGAIGDRYGRKTVLITGLMTFAVGAAISAVSTDIAVMLLGRVVTGVGAAAVLPNALAVLVNATEPRRRSRAISIWAAMTGAGGVVGNVGGGALLSLGSWRWLFAVVAPIAVLCAACVAAATPRTDHSHRALNVLPAALLTASTFALLLGIIQGPEQGWGSSFVVCAFVGAVALCAAWTLSELHVDQPMLDPRLFLVPGLRAACLGMLILFFGMFGLFYLNASLLQYGRGFTVLEAGLAVVPMTVPLLVGARYVPALVVRVGGRAVLAAAFALTSVGLFGLATAIGEPYPLYAMWLVVAGSGIALALPSLTIAISAALPPERAGVAGGLQSTTRELGSALGVAVVGTLLTSKFTQHLTTAVSGRATVAEALAAAPTHHDAIIGAYAASCETALQVIALVVLVAGALVIGEMTWATRTERGR